MKRIVVPFTEGGVPVIGLSPTITILDVETDLVVVNGAAMDEMGGGWYKHEFVAYDSDKDYAITVDGGSGQPVVERFAFAGNENYVLDLRDPIIANDNSNKDEILDRIDLIEKGPPVAIFD